MNITRVATHSGESQRVLSANSTNTSALTVPVDITGSPKGVTGYIDCRTSRKGNGVHNFAEVNVIGTNAEDEAGEVRCYGVKAVRHPSGKRWNHAPLWRVTATLGALTTPETAEFYADTLVMGSDHSGATVYSSDVTAFADSTARIEFDLRGYPYLFFQFDRATAEDLNAIVRMY